MLLIEEKGQVEKNGIRLVVLYSESGRDVGLRVANTDWSKQAGRFRRGYLIDFHASDDADR